MAKRLLLLQGLLLGIGCDGFTQTKSIAKNGRLWETPSTTPAPFEFEGHSFFDEYPEDYRCGFVSILGAPNMGKSTLLNALIQEDLCIATARPQTTRHAILGLISTETCQVCLVDTPGVIDDPAYKLQEGMMQAVIGAFHDADVLLVVTDLFSTPIPDDELFEKVKCSDKPVIVAVNKVDLSTKVNTASPENQDKTVTAEQAVAMWRLLLPDALAIVPCAASEGPEEIGVVALRNLLVGSPDVGAAFRDLGRPLQGMFHPSIGTLISDEVAQSLLPKSPPLYDQEVLTDRTERFVASEMVRAALFECLKKELPYCCEVRIDYYKEPREGQNRIVKIGATVIVERDSQKAIVIGKNGEKIKEVGVKAREKIQDFLRGKVSLYW